MEVQRDLRDEPLNKRLPESIFNRIHEDIGAASMCWNPPPSKEVFDSECASAIAFNLCHFVADAIDEVKSDVQTFLAEREWVSVKTKLPGDGLYLGRVKNLSYGNVWIDVVSYCPNLSSHQWGIVACTGDPLEVTHWMPLPPPPQEEKR